MKQKRFTIAQVAELCGRTKDAIQQARRRGKFPHVKFNRLHKAYEIPRGDVREYLFIAHGIILQEAEEARDKEIKADE